MNDDESAADRRTDPDGDDELDVGLDVAPRSHLWVFPVIAVLVVLGFGIAAFMILSGGDSDASVGPEGVPVQNVPDLASAKSTVKGTAVNGITCRPSMGQGVEYHIHQHVNIFVNGTQKRLPAGIGITEPYWEQQIDGYPFINNSAKSCVYWLHTHANDGIVHVESPTTRTFTLGDFFDVWNQPLSATQVGPAKGPVTAYLDGKRYADPRSIPLTEGGVIQLNVGEPEVPFKDMDFTVKNVCGDGTLSCSPTGADMNMGDGGAASSPSGASTHSHS